VGNLCGSGVTVETPDDVTETVRGLPERGAGDLTAGSSANASAEAQVITREDAVLCGTAWLDEVFRQVDERIRVIWRAKDSEAINAGQGLCKIIGPARGLLTGERVALNFLQLLSGVATRTRQYVDAVRGTKANILDTRKTVPGLRRAQKYAVACGGGQNHRMGLYDAILIKENHIAAAGSITAALEAARHSAPKGISIEIEGQYRATARGRRRADRLRRQF
jgi:nicotinate-nucleotide pyrophosphorylase (carboxylating)